jgi:antitoxin (DNA-binding transcriptional repressor) of toxin-antitoxin stability system
MKTIEMAEATAPLADYARGNRKETLIITRRGRPIAALTPIGPRTDPENITVSNSREFRALIARSRRAHPPGTGLTTAEVRRTLATRRARTSRGRR